MKGVRDIVFWGGVLAGYARAGGPKGGGEVTPPPYHHSFALPLLLPK